MKIKLMTKALRARLPAIYSTEQTPVLKKIAQAAYFTPDSNWYWYPVEFDGTDEFFGLVAGQYVELGYFRLSELQAIRGPWKLWVERDLWFEPTQLEEVLKRFQDRPGASILMGIDRD